MFNLFQMPTKKHATVIEKTLLQTIPKMFFLNLGIICVTENLGSTVLVHI